MNEPKEEVEARVGAGLIYHPAVSGWNNLYQTILTCFCVKPKPRQVHALCDCWNTGGHFPPLGCVAPLFWERSSRQQDYLAWRTMLEGMRVGV